MEIERKFWIKENNLIFDYERTSLIEQIYLNKNEDFYEIRLRKYHNENKYYLDFKSNGDLSRNEFGTKINEEQFNNILKGFKIEDLKRNTILKQRYYIKNGIFFDKYLGDLEGYNTLEIEGDLNIVQKFKLFEPFNNGIEVTYDNRFKNRNVVGKTYEYVKLLEKYKN